MDAVALAALHQLATHPLQSVAKAESRARAFALHGELAKRGNDEPRIGQRVGEVELQLGAIEERRSGQLEQGISRLIGIVALRR
jgi:hypothetical protein